MPKTAKDYSDLGAIPYDDFSDLGAVPIADNDFSDIGAIPFDEVKQYGMDTSFLKRFALSGSNVLGDANKHSVLVSGPSKVGEVLGRFFQGERDFEDINPIERSFHSGLSRTFGEAVSQIPSAVYSGHKYITKNLPELAVRKTAQKLGLFPEQYSEYISKADDPSIEQVKRRDFDKTPDWIVNNPVSNFFRGSAQALNYNRKKYGLENAFTLWGNGDPESAVDWTINAVAENLPYSLFSTVLTASGVPAPAVLGLTGTLAGLGMMREEFDKPNLNQLQQIHSLFLKSTAEGMSEYVGAKLFPFASQLFQGVGVKAGKEAIKGSLKKALSGIAFGPLEEGVEEFATGVAQGAVDMFYQSVDNLTWQKVIDQAKLEGFLGFASGGVYSAGAMMQSSLEMGNPAMIREGMEASDLNKTQGVDTRMTLDELMEIKARLNAKNKGLERPETGEALTVPQTLSAEEVALLEKTEKDILDGNYKEPQDEAVKQLGDAISGDILVNMAKASFEDQIREKTAKGEELDANEKAYLEFQKQRTSEIKNADMETAKGMSSEDYLAWANDRAKTSYTTHQELLDAKELHKSLIDHGEFEVAAKVRKAVSRETEIGQKTASEMEALESEIESKIGDDAIQATEQELAKKYQELEDLDNQAIGEITPEYEEKVKGLIEEIKTLEQNKSEQTKYRKELESKKRGIQVSEPEIQTEKRDTIEQFTNRGDAVSEYNILNARHSGEYELVHEGKFWEIVRRQKKEKVHSLEITPSMKESVMAEGQALFEPKQGYLPGMEGGAKLPSEKEVAYGSEKMANEGLEKTIQAIQAKYDPQNLRRASIVSALQKRKFVDFTGQKIESADSLAELHQVFRSPAVETFVYYVTKPDGTIFVNRAISSGHLDQVIIGDEVFDSMFIDLLNSGEGSKLWLAHNHPSGRTVSSQEDIMLTAKVKRYFPRAYTGHVVIDHGKYLLIGKELETSQGFYMVNKEGREMDWRSGLATVNEPDHLAVYFDDVLRSPESLHIIFLDKGNNIVAYEVKSTKELETDLFVKMKHSMTSFATNSYILMGDPKTIKTLTEKGSPYGIFPNRILDIIEVSSSGVTSYVEQRKELPHISKQGVFEPSENYGKKQRVTPEFEAKYAEAEAFLQDYKTFRKQVGKMRKYEGKFMAEELADIPSFYWTREQTAPTPDDRANEMGYESDEALLNAIREAEAKKNKYLPFMKEAKEILAEEREFRREFEKGRKYGYSEGYKEASKIIREKFALKTASEQEIKDVIVEYAIEFLPKDMRGELITQVRDATTMLDAFKAFQRVDELVEKDQRSQLVSTLKKLLKRVSEAKNIDIRYKTLIEELADSISFTKPRQATLERLQKTKEFIEAEIKAGREVSLPSYVYASLKILDRIAVKDLSLEELEFMIDRVSLAIEIGQTKLKARLSVYEADKQRILNGLKNANLNKAEYSKDLQGAMKKVADWALLLNQAKAPMDHFFLGLGDEAHRLLKRGIDSKYANFLTRFRNLEEKTNELIKKLNLNEKNMERIGIFGADQQENGREKLLYKYTEKEIEAVKLDKNEMEFYQFMRSELDNVRPEYEKMLNEVFNLPLGEVVNYFPFLSNFEDMSDSEIRDRFAHLADYSPQLRKTVDISSSIPRVDRHGVQKIRVDAANVFLHHMETVFYAVELAEDIKKLQEIARTPEFGEAAGEVGQEVTRQWLDVMARKGGRMQAKKGLDRMIDFLRKNMSVSQLAFNPASILLQLTATMDGAMLIGNYAFMAQPLVFEDKFREFALNNSAQLKNRVGDDFAFREFGKSWWGKLQSGAMTPQKMMDGMVATGVWIGAYQKYLDENKLKLDLNNPVKEATDYANQMMTMTQASGSFKDLPVSITRAVATGGNESFAKALAQFQTFAFFRFANLASAVRAIKSKDYATAGQIVAWWTVANLSELAIRHGVKGVIGLLFLGILGSRGERDDEEKNIFLQILGSLIGNTPYLSNVVSAIVYKSNPVAIISAYENAMESWEYFSRSKKAGKKIKWATVAALQTAGLLAGAPVGQATKMIKQAESASSAKPFDKYLETDLKAKALFNKFKKIRSEVDSQYKAIKDAPKDFDDKHRFKISNIYKKINTVESDISYFNKQGSGNGSRITSALEEVRKLYEN